jgi:acrylyl-CoA reductase (NADPH)
MAESFEALLVSKGEAGQTADFVRLDETDLMPGDVTVQVSHSTVNYKDGLAVTGKAPILRQLPLIPGIDFAGTVLRSDNPGYAPGDPVVLTGWGVGETHHGGYAERARVPGDWLVPLPDGLTPARAMAIGTAGFTAMLAVLALERHGVEPEVGAVLVTGASGGVGSVAIAILARLGFHVTASTGRLAEADYLRTLGATEILDRAELAGEGRPLGKERWAAAIDSVGSRTLVNVLSQTRSEGVVAACGLAQGSDLPGTVLPFILRGVTLAGINSVAVPKPRRIEVWRRLARDLDMTRLDGMTRRIGLRDVPTAAKDILEGRVRGRLVVEIAPVGERRSVA